MAIRTISLSTFKELFGENQNQHNNFSRDIKAILPATLISLNIDKVDMYNLKREKHNYRAGNINRLVIFSNATMEGCGEVPLLSEPKLINGIENDFVSFLAPKGDGVLIKSEEGIVLAEWHESTYELNILFDLFKKYTPNAVEIFKYIMQEFEKLVWYPKTMANSWKLEGNRDRLIKTFTDVSRRQRQGQIEEAKRQIERMENDLNNYRRQIKSTADNLYIKRRQLDVDIESLNNISAGLLKDLDLIINHDKIQDLHIKDGKFIIYTKPIYIYSDKGHKYYGGNYRIELNPENSDVLFFGGTPRKSYWTNQDPHPHVSGSSGRPCLGNVASTIAELCSQMQIYALVMVCIDFLESANTSDAAGKNVVNWDLVDESGNIVAEEEREDLEGEYFVCEICGNRHRTDDAYTVYDSIDYDERDCDNCDEDCDCCDDEREYTLGREMIVCERCESNACYWDDVAEVYVRS